MKKLLKFTNLNKAILFSLVTIPVAVAFMSAKDCWGADIKDTFDSILAAIKAETDITKKNLLKAKLTTSDKAIKPIPLNQKNQLPPFPVETVYMILDAIEANPNDSTLKAKLTTSNKAIQSDTVDSILAAIKAETDITKKNLLKAKLTTSDKAIKAIPLNQTNKLPPFPVETVDMILNEIEANPNDLTLKAKLAVK